MTGNRKVTVVAPAKINLGLEILGRREDGYHEIRTILAAIGLADTLDITLIPERANSRILGVKGVRQHDNLIQKAIDAFAEETGISYGYDIDVAKHIPSPGGLGGASSDAASTLMGLNATHGTPLPTERMFTLAAKLGSDVPFFIGPPVALASGTGTSLEELAPVQGHVVLVVPPLHIPAKTGRLYGLLGPDDFTDGRRVERAAEAILAGNLPDPSLLHNAFARPLYELAPELTSVARTLEDAGASHVALSGAGPAHYVLFEQQTEADRFAADVRARLPQDTVVVSTPVHAHPVSVDLAQT
jgi:4-diphosphocytidyl-2-C-methyl-D-erythritol kinase